MKIFIDAEFYEFGPYHEPTHFANGCSFVPKAGGGNAVQLISLGAVREDGVKFYAENASFDWDNVPDTHWLQENVRPVLLGQQPQVPERFFYRKENGYGGLWDPSRIADEFHTFATIALDDSGGVAIDPEFWGYFSDYDWVVLCGLYERMVDLPSEFPKYCLDLKQEMHRLGIKRYELPDRDSRFAHHALDDARWIRDAYNFVQRRQHEEV